MKGLLTIIIAFLFAEALGQQTESRNIGSFDGLGASESIEVHLKKGDNESVRIETNGIDLHEVYTDVSGGYLKIHLGGGHHRSGTVKVFVTYQALDRIFASAAAGIYNEGVLESSSLKIGGSSAGTIRLNISVKALSVSVSSAANVQLTGHAAAVDAEASSAGELDGYDLSAASAVIRTSSAGSIQITVTDSIEANASSGGSIRYRGNPSRAITHSTSGGSVRKGG